MSELAQVTLGKSVGDRFFDRGSYRPPRAAKQRRHLRRHGNVRDHSASVTISSLVNRCLPEAHGIHCIWIPAQQPQLTRRGA